MLKHILVYGSLKAGQCNHDLLKDDVDFVGKVRVPGFDLYNLGWYPGIRENPENKQGVECELYQLKNEEVIKKADYYEGYVEDDHAISLFVRKEVEIPDGPKAYVYEYNRDPHNKALKIEEGVW